MGKNGKINFGKDFTITAEATIISNRLVHFGNKCLLSWDILIMDDDFHDIYNEKGELINPPKDIVIGDNVWIGCKSIILKGSVVPNNSIIAAGTIITKKLKEENSIYGGNPLQIMRRDIKWKQ